MAADKDQSQPLANQGQPTPDAQGDTSAPPTAPPTDTPQQEPAPAKSPGTSDSPIRINRLASWMVLALCLGLTAPALLIDLHQPDVIHPDEAKAIAVSVHTWQRQLMLTEVEGPRDGSLCPLPQWRAPVQTAPRNHLATQRRLLITT